MCIIIIKPKGKSLPTYDIFKNCWNHNNHGIGFMYHKNDRVIIEKGYMDFISFEKKLNVLEKKIDIKNTTIVFHFRISTSGNIDKGNCHPFPISFNNNSLRATNIETVLGIAHNGTIFHYTEMDKILNDTQLFIKNDLSTLYRLDNHFYFNNSLISIIKRLINNDRMVFLTGNGNIIKFGEWINEDGYYFSNNSYIKSKNIKSYNNKNQIFEDNFNEQYKINNCIVDEEDFEMMLDYLEQIPFGKTIYSYDKLDEYSWKDKEIYIDESDKSYYYVTNKSISYLGNYELKIDF